MTGAELDTLISLIERGPLEDGDVPSKCGRDSLIEKGLAVRIVVQLQDARTAATYKGRDAYCEYFGTAMGGKADTMREAKAMREAMRSIRNASAKS